MTPVSRRIALALAPLALVGAACGVASADWYFPTGSVAENGSSVTTQVTWRSRLLALPGTGDTMDVRLVGTARGGTPVVFGSAEVKRNGQRTQTVRIPVKRSLRGTLRTAKHLVVTSTQHYDSPTDGDTVPERHLAAVTAIRGTLTTNPASGKALRACATSLVKAGADLRNCDLRGVDLSGADLRGVRLSHASLDGANLKGAKLSGAVLTGTSLLGANTTGADFGNTEMTGYTLPDAAAPSNTYGADCSGGGGPLCQAIYSATTSLDLVFYQVGGPNVVKWLQDAVRRGVAVRVIVNSANTEPGCTIPSAADQNCAWSPKADPYYALEAQLKAALPAGAPNVPRVQFSSQNFNITHQKTIIVDAAKVDGTPLSSTELPPTAEALVSSGNLQAFPNNWGQYAEKVNNTWTVVNPDYLTNPSKLCAPPQGCDTEWSPRDFVVAVRQYDGTGAGVTDPGKEGVSRIEGVFASDFGCAPGNVNNVGSLIPDPTDKSAATASWPETWSNGSTYAPGDVGGAKQPPASMVNDYPLPWSSADPTSGYFSTDGGYVDTLQGNVRTRQVALINSAKTSITVYNEEMSDFTKPKWNSQTKTMGPIPTTNSGNSIVNALINAARRGVKVTIIMANGYTASGGVDRSSTTWAASFDALKGFGDYTAVYDPTLYPKAVVPTISLLPETTGLYIHGKAFVADNTDGWIGSINASYGSMNTNRELGVGVTNRSDGSKPAIASYFSPSMIAGVQNAAAKDAPVGKPWPTGTASRTVKSGTFVPSAQFPCINTQANADTGLPVRTLPAPSFASIMGTPTK